MYSIKTEGIILRRRNINEADKLLTVLTKSNGKITVKAPGIRKISSRRSSHVELLNRTVISLYGRHTIPVLIEAQMISDYKFIKQDLTKVGFAYHICEITDGLCAEGQENESVFNSLVSVLDNLCVTLDPASVVHEYEMKLLDLLGFGTSRMYDNEFFNIHTYIENILERKLKSKDIFG